LKDEVEVEKKEICIQMIEELKEAIKTVEEKLGNLRGYL